MSKGCGKDFEIWYYDQDGIPTHSETMECDEYDLCDECKKDVKVLEDEV